MASSGNFSIFTEKYSFFDFHELFKLNQENCKIGYSANARQNWVVSTFLWRVAQPLWSAAWVFMAVDHFSGVMNFIKWNHAACTGKHPDECSVDDAVNDKISLCCSVCNLKQWIFSFKCTLQAYKICFQIASASTKWRYDQWNRERFLHKHLFFQWMSKHSPMIFQDHSILLHLIS